MKIGNFNMSDYMNKLYESEDGNIESSNKDGIIIPDENKKSFDWLKKEYDSNQTEIKVEITNGSNKATKPTEFINDKNGEGDGTKSDFKQGQFGADQKNLGDGSKSDFKPFNGSNNNLSGESGDKSKNSDKSDEKETKENVEADSTKKKVSIKGIKPKTAQKEDKSK